MRDLILADFNVDPDEVENLDDDLDVLCSAEADLRSFVSVQMALTAEYVYN